MAEYREADPDKLESLAKTMRLFGDQLKKDSRDICLQADELEFSDADSERILNNLVKLYAHIIQNAIPTLDAAARQFENYANWLRQ